MSPFPTVPSDIFEIVSLSDSSQIQNMFTDNFDDIDNMIYTFCDMIMQHSTMTVRTVPLDSSNFDSMLRLIDK